jgi:hypothetical protein
MTGTSLSDPDKDEMTSSATVFLRREAPEKDVVDIASQIVTISATELTDTQLRLLAAASQRGDRDLEWPSNLTGGAAGKVVAKLLMVEEIQSRGSCVASRRGRCAHPAHHQARPSGDPGSTTRRPRPRPDELPKKRIGPGLRRLVLCLIEVNGCAGAITRRYSTGLHS